MARRQRGARAGAPRATASRLDDWEQLLAFIVDPSQPAACASRGGRRRCCAHLLRRAGIDERRVLGARPRAPRPASSWPLTRGQSRALPALELTAFDIDKLLKERFRREPLTVGSAWHHGYWRSLLLARRHHPPGQRRPARGVRDRLGHRAQAAGGGLSRRREGRRLDELRSIRLDMPLVVGPHPLRRRLRDGARLPARPSPQADPAHDIRTRTLVVVEADQLPAPRRSAVASRRRPAGPRSAPRHAAAARATGRSARRAGARRPHRRARPVGGRGWRVRGPTPPPTTARPTRAARANSPPRCSASTRPSCCRCTLRYDGAALLATRLEAAARLRRRRARALSRRRAQVVPAHAARRRLPQGAAAARPRAAALRRRRRRHAGLRGDGLRERAAGRQRRRDDARRRHRPGARGSSTSLGGAEREPLTPRARRRRSGPSLREMALCTPHLLAAQRPRLPELHGHRRRAEDLGQHDGDHHDRGLGARGRRAGDRRVRPPQRRAERGAGGGRARAGRRARALPRLALLRRAASRTCRS